MQSTMNQLKHRKGRAVRDNGTQGVVSIDHTALRLYGYLDHTPPITIARAYSTFFRANTDISRSG